MSVNYATKYQSKVAERFKKGSITDRACGHDYSFAQAKSIVVQSVDVVALNDYNRTAASNRFGSVTNLGDTMQTMTMTQDKSFTFAIDAGDQSDQAIDKSAGKALRREIDEVVTPTMDKYRLNKWATGAGITLYSGTSAALTKTTVLPAILAVNGEMSNNLVPEENRTLFVPNSLYILLKQADAILNLEKMGDAAVAKGEVGQIDNCRLVRVPDSWFPTGFQFFIKYANCTVDPVKLTHYRVLTEAQGFDGPVVEGRVYYDSFVLAAKESGIAAYKLGTAPA